MKITLESGTMRCTLESGGPLVIAWHDESISIPHNLALTILQGTGDLPDGVRNQALADIHTGGLPAGMRVTTSRPAPRPQRAPQLAARRAKQLWEYVRDWMVEYPGPHTVAELAVVGERLGWPHVGRMDHSLLVTLGRRKEHFVELYHHAYGLVGAEFGAEVASEFVKDKPKPKRDRSGPPLWQPLTRWMADHPGPHAVSELAEVARAEGWVRHGEVYQAVLVCCFRRPETFNETDHHTFELVEGAAIPSIYRPRSHLHTHHHAADHLVPSEPLPGPRVVRRRPGEEDRVVSDELALEVDDDDNGTGNGNGHGGEPLRALDATLQTSLEPHIHVHDLGHDGESDLCELITNWMRVTPGAHSLDDLTVAGIERQWPAKGPVRRAIEKALRRESDRFREVRPGHFELRP